MEPANAASPTPEEAFDVVFGFNALEFLKTRGFIGTGNLFVRREVFDRVGGFRSGVSEDVEWSHRAKALGFSLHHVPGAVVGHPARSGWDDLVRTWNRRTREAYLLAREQPSGKLRWILQAYLVLISPLPHILKVLRCPYLTAWRDRWGAIQVLFRIRFHRFVQAFRIMRDVERDAAYGAAAPAPVRSPGGSRPDNGHE